mmetsp:Transcript_117896/g.313647  ORF Transcript_117896/g.313647 Transcript_117896/m.313647 type:complete len:264 (-) Transcript_117896:1025-1816(-)
MRWHPRVPAAPRLRAAPEEDGKASPAGTVAAKKAVLRELRLERRALQAAHGLGDLLFAGIAHDVLAGGLHPQLLAEASEGGDIDPVDQPHIFSVRDPPMDLPGCARPLQRRASGPLPSPELRLVELRLALRRQGLHVLARRHRSSCLMLPFQKVCRRRGRGRLHLLRQGGRRWPKLLLQPGYHRLHVLGVDAHHPSLGQELLHLRQGLHPVDGAQHGQLGSRLGLKLLHLLQGAGLPRRRNHLDLLLHFFPHRLFLAVRGTAV